MALCGQDSLERFFAGAGALLARTPALLPRPELARFIDAVGACIDRTEAKHRDRDRTAATRFNVFDLIDPDENGLSEVLQMLLNPSGLHGQGDLFLRLFLAQLGIGLSQNARVRREVLTHGIRRCRRRVDILIEANVLVAIENKVDSAEQPEQVRDYLEHLRYCAKDSGRKHVLIYLTPTDCPPGSLTDEERKAEEAAGRLRCWSYQKELRRWLESCRQKCRAEKIVYFLGDLIAYIDTVMRRRSRIDESGQIDA